MLPEDFDAVILTPGAYIAYRRKAAGLGIEDVAHVVATVPSIPEHRRGEWLKLIEADAVPVAWNTLVALRQVVPIDLRVLEQLELIHAGDTRRPPRLCAHCAGSDIGEIGLARREWAEAQLCLPCALTIHAGDQAA